jgi:predicted dehydrogenase
MSQRVLKVGLVGGGGGAFIAHPHQRAIHFDGTRRVVCAALHPSADVALREADNWPYPIHGYANYDELIETEAKKPVGERIDYALIVTPNHVHYDPARKLLAAGIPVMCEKPLTMTVEEADELVQQVRRQQIPFCTAHTYIGHWTTRLCRHMVRSGLLGEIRWVDAYYLQGWLFERAEDKGVLQAEWRVDPQRAGLSGCGGVKAVRGSTCSSDVGATEEHPHCSVGVLPSKVSCGRCSLYQSMMSPSSRSKAV